MPELPEVETVKIGLDRLLPGKIVKSLTFDWPKGFPNSIEDVNNFIIRSKIVKVRRRAKVLMIDLSSDYTLVTHLKMTGQLVFIGQQKPQIRKQKHEIRNRTKSSKNRLGLHASDLEFAKSGESRFGAGHPNDSLIGKLPDKSTRVIINFGDSKLFFNDQRKFGWMRLIPTSEVQNIDFMKRLGPEPLSSNFTNIEFRERLHRRKNSSIKSVLLDQSVIAGVGNIYADESLWGAKIHPASLAKNISDTKLNKLFKELQYVLRLAIEKGGSTDRNYVNAEGKKGSYMSFARVFRREGQPCPRCRKTIVKTRVAGRGTHYCPKCQTNN